MRCDFCGEEKPRFAKGLCSACYSRQRRSGRLERVNSVNKGKLCSVEGCTRPAMANGMCTPHYTKSQHPLKDTWKLIRSRSGDGGYPERWDDFEKFLDDVGQRPTPRHKLRRVDPSKPYSKRNVYWQAPIKGDFEDNAEYTRAWRYRQSFGLDYEEYERLLKEQGGVCAICHQEETFKSPISNKPRMLALDHCHASGDTRALLCNRCNRMLGLAKDDSDLLRGAADYLDRYKSGD